MAKVTRKNSKTKTKTSKAKTTKAKGKNGNGRGNAFDPDKMEVAGTVKLSDETRAQIYSYDEGEPSVNFIRKTQAGKKYPVKKLTRAEAEKFAKRIKKVMRLFDELEDVE